MVLISGRTTRARASEGDKERAREGERAYNSLQAQDIMKKPDLVRKPTQETMMT